MGHETAGEIAQVGKGANRAVAATRDRKLLTVEVDLSVDADLASLEEVFTLN